jgi:hypothetical protein
MREELPSTHVVELGELVREGVDVGHVLLADRLDLPLAPV